MFKIIDYYTNKQIIKNLFPSWDAAHEASKKWLKEMANSKAIHNNLHYIVQV